MLPCNPSDAGWTSRPVPLYVWRPPGDLQHLTVWHDFPYTFLHEVPAHRPSYRTSDCAGVSMESGFHNLVIKRSTPRENRGFFLDRSIYDLVAAYRYLTLTDRRLLGWYLSLSPEDRRLIQDEGGLFQFLRRHPALGIYRHHIYVKYGTSPTQPAMTANQQVCTTAGAEMNIRETPKIHLDLERLPSNVKDSLTLLGCSSNRNKEQENLCGQQVHIPDGFHSGSSSPGTQEKNHQQAHYRPGLPLSQLNEGRHSGQMGSSAAVFEDPAGLASFSLDMQLERCRQRRKLEPRSLISVPQGQSADFSPSWGDPPAAGTEEPHQSATKVKTAVKHTSTCDAMIGTELVLCPSVFTQTEELGTADKHINTEVYMADLDYVTKEFNKLKKAQKERKEKTKSVGCKLRGGCECLERVEQAELALLALQYSVCKQHCWRLYNTSAEGNQLILGAKDPPPNIVSVLQKLELDYKEMKSKIQAGVPLQQIKPLSVDAGEIITGGNYIPAQIICEVLGEDSSWSSREAQKLNTPGGDGGGCPDNWSIEAPQVGQEEEKWVKKENVRRSRAATLFPKNGASAGQEVDTGEKWYDAEEELELPGGGVAPAVTLDPPLVTVDASCESASEEAKSSVLCVSNLPFSVTERDVMLLFEKYRPSAVSISALKALRFAIVMLSGPQSADAAARELNGCQMQGHTLHLEHISGTRSSSQASARKSDSLQDAAKPQTSEMDSGSTESQLVTRPSVRPSIRSRKVVSISPAAKGSFVPQNYGTMDSFEILMAELTQLHPDVGKQRIVDALMELRVKHQVVLCGLPLRTIREMTSDLLTGPQTAKE